MSKPLILMYHRIADEPVDYWGLAVSPAHFEEQLSVLRRTRRPLPLTQFVDELVAGTLAHDTVALTFDDGYVDNLDAGLPRLEAADVPATVFLATGFLDRLEPFWWDELANLTLREDGPQSLEVVIRGQTATFSIDAYSAISHGAATPGALNERHVFLEAIYHPLRHLDEAERRAVMAKLRASFPMHVPPSSRAMTSNEVRALVRGGLVTIGAHTVTHPSLPALAGANRRQEIVASRLVCEVLAAAPVTAFAFPFGEYDVETCEIVRTAGFAFACATGRAPAATASDVFALRRLYIPNLDGDEFEQRLRWASDSW